MAKRKRLSPADPDSARRRPPAPETGPLRRAPIAEVAGDASAHAALSRMASEIETARAEGRMLVALPLESIDAGYLVRDRLVSDADDMDALVASLRDRGQQTPADVVDLGQGRYGLISGWRRLMALQQLHAETGEARFAVLHCLVRAPDTAAEAYRAMVEENEIRAGISFYERALVAAKAAEIGAFASPRDAVRALFAAGSRARRSKINSFLAVHEALGGVLRFPTALSERTGLALAKALGEDKGFAARVAQALRAAPERDAPTELAILSEVAQPRPNRPKTESDRPEQSLSEPAEHEISVQKTQQGLLLRGTGVDAAFEARLRAWLADQTGS